MRSRHRKTQNNALCKYLWSRMVLREPVVLLGSQVMKGAINGDEDTTSVKSSVCFKLVRKNICSHDIKRHSQKLKLLRFSSRASRTK